MLSFFTPLVLTALITSRRFNGFFLVIIIRDSFGKIGGQVFSLPWYQYFD